MRLGKRFLELFELSAGERGPDAALFALLRTDGRRVNVMVRRLVVIHLVRQADSRCSTQPCHNLLQ